jgi:hypothetical protein
MFVKNESIVFIVTHVIRVCKKLKVLLYSQCKWKNYCLQKNENITPLSLNIIFYKYCLPISLWVLQKKV